MDDPKCNVCGEPKSAHVATKKGPFTHPREARGEGHYEMVSQGATFGSIHPWEDDIECGPTYRFVKAKKAG